MKTTTECFTKPPKFGRNVFDFSAQCIGTFQIDCKQMKCNALFHIVVVWFMHEKKLIELFEYNSRELSAICRSQGLDLMQCISLPTLCVVQAPIAH